MDLSLSCTSEQRGGILSTHWHLLIMDGHNSHVTMAVVEQARAANLELLTMLSHTLHVLKPLDLSIIKPFKSAFRIYHDAWSLSNKGKSAIKEVLA
jgi:hypothetical protein